MGLGTRFDPGVIGTPLSVVGGLLDELVGALAKSAKGCDRSRKTTNRKNCTFTSPNNPVTLVPSGVAVV